METNNIEELARIASGVKLAAGYKEALASQPDNIKNSSRMQKIIAYLEQNETATLKDIAMALYNRPDAASVNQLVKALKQTGIIEDTGLIAPKQVKASVNAPGVKGRPKVTNDEIKMLGGGALRKFAKGETDFTPEEIDFITQLYNAATSISEAEIAEVTQEDLINENKKMKNNLTEARFQFLAGVINENEFKNLNEATEAAAWLVDEENGLPKIIRFASVEQARDNQIDDMVDDPYKRPLFTSLASLADYLDKRYDITNVEPYRYLK
jgi:hypothetical protein